jgi:hypothetical protein
MMYLESSEDIDYISSKEIELQREYGYKVDMVPYKNLKPKKNMNINVTEQTTTFPVPVNKLKGRLMDNIGMSWNTEHGELNITPATVDWIMKMLKLLCLTTRDVIFTIKHLLGFTITMMFLLNPLKNTKPLKMFDNIRDWAQTKRFI